jgi:hypothetical protein
MSEHILIKRYTKVGSVWENTHSKDGTEYVDDEGKPAPRYNEKMTANMALFPNKSFAEGVKGAPMYDILIDNLAEQNKYKKE